MRYLLLSFIIFFSIVGCSSDSGTMELTGQVRGLKKGTLLLQKFKDTALVTIDSMVINGDANFSFSEKIESPEIYYLLVKLKDGTLMDDRISFFAEGKEINIRTNLKNFGHGAVVSGSVNDSLLSDYKKIKQRYLNKNLDLIQEKLSLTQTEGDSIFQQLDKQQNSLNTSKYLATINFALNKKEHEIAPFLMVSEVPDANIKYMDTVYNVLPTHIKDSKYGKALSKLISERKTEAN